VHRHLTYHPRLYRTLRRGRCHNLRLRFVELYRHCR
jgi:hypothetical protein